MYHVALPPSDESEQLAQQWGIAYVALYDDDLRASGAPLQPVPGSWLERAPARGTNRLYKVH